MIKIRLEDAEIRKLSEITQISEFDLQKLYTEGLLNDSAVLNRLMKYDFQLIKRMGKYRPGQIIARIAMKYHVSTNRVHTAIYQKKAPLVDCEECGKLVGKAEYNRNNGLCDNCVAKSIELP